MTTLIERLANSRQITRLCHFTPSRNFVHIATDGKGLLASSKLSEDARSVFSATDRQRLDGFPDHVCCSIQYPNAWYFRKARRDERIFKDWVVLLLNPRHLWTAGTKFCHRNAAANFGSDVAEGETAFDSLFATSVLGSQNRTYGREASHPTWLPTDEQAEVLIPDRVERDDLLGIVVADEAQAKREQSRLVQLEAEPLPIYVCSDFFEAYALSKMLRVGRMPTEVLFVPGDRS